MANPEIDQLSGQFSNRRGRVGILTCRELEDNFIKRCADTYEDERGLVIPLEDKLFNEDCNELMKRLPTQSVDLILTDPPYNISQYSTGNIPREGKITLNNDIADWDKKIINPVEYVDVFKRIINFDKAFTWNRWVFFCF